MTRNNGQWRVQFDAEVAFRNGGGLRAWEFRLDAPGPDLSDEQVAEMFVRHLGLLMVDTVDITDKVSLREPHKGSRGMTADHTDPGTPRAVIPLSATPWDPTAPLLLTPAPHPETTAHPSGLLDLQGTVVRTTGSSRRTVETATLFASPVAGRAVLLDTDADIPTAEPDLTPQAARWLADSGAILVGLGRTAPEDEPATTVLRDAGIPVVTGLRGLKALPPHGFRFHAVPLEQPAGDAPAVPVTCYAVTGAG